jgi:hypothetical protein
MKENNIELRIKEKIEELSIVFNDIDPNTQRTIEPLISKAAFMSVTLDNLQRTINEKGVIEEYQNGANQSGFKESVEVKVYNTMIKNYHAVMKQLIDLLPNKSEGQIAGDSIKAFLGK